MSINQEIAIQLLPPRILMVIDNLLITLICGMCLFASPLNSS